ncbi:hypothetical protein EWM64_g7022 [Hericium alpestre]|uniref:Uncharacterized protein n=1 Tax=Hericium alpestre TaxID=135208 RepID=A0A4Y9ZRX9_9AGAM|nr:hypothetical protein EWM64_g7022 [Hericium alpestre]
MCPKHQTDCCLTRLDLETEPSHGGASLSGGAGPDQSRYLRYGHALSSVTTASDHKYNAPNLPIASSSKEQLDYGPYYAPIVRIGLQTESSHKNTLRPSSPSADDDIPAHISISHQSSHQSADLATSSSASQCTPTATSTTAPETAAPASAAAASTSRGAHDVDWERHDAYHKAKKESMIVTHRLSNMKCPKRKSPTHPPDTRSEDSQAKHKKRKQESPTTKAAPAGQKDEGRENGMDTVQLSEQVRNPLQLGDNRSGMEQDGLRDRALHDCIAALKTENAQIRSKLDQLLENAKVAFETERRQAALRICDLKYTVDDLRSQLGKLEGDSYRAIAAKDWKIVELQIELHKLHTEDRNQS